MLTKGEVKAKWIEIIESVHRDHVFSSIEGAWQLAQWVEKGLHPVTRAVPDLEHLIKDLKDICLMIDGNAQAILEKIIEELEYCLENDKSNNANG